MDVKQLRSLYLTELYLELEMANKHVIFPNAFLIESKINLFENLSIIQSAIQHWKLMHPLLTCNIDTFDGKKEKYFCCKPGSTDPQTVLNNVTLLKYKSSSSSSTKHASCDEWTLLFQREMTRAFKSDTELLWRLTIVDTATENQYWFILTVHHAISDGRNVYAIMLELCQLIQEAHYDSLKGINQEQGVLEYNYPNDPRNPYVEVPLDISVLMNRLGLMEPAIVPECSIKDQNGPSCIEPDMHADDGFYNLDGTLNVSLNDLLKQSCVNPTGLRHIKFDKQEFEELLQRSKENRVKLTSVLCLINFLAFHNTVNTLSNGSERVQELSAIIPINLRQFLEPPLDYTVCGNWMSRLSVKFNTNLLSENTNEFLKTNFWQYAKQQSDEFHARMEEREQFVLFSFNEQLLAAFYNGFKMSVNSVHFTLSNIGDQLSNLSECTDFKILEYYSGISAEENSNGSAVQNALVTINSQLYWTITYSNFKIKNDFVENWLKEIRNIIHVLIE